MAVYQIGRLIQPTIPKLDGAVWWMDGDKGRALPPQDQKTRLARSKIKAKSLTNQSYRKFIVHVVLYIYMTVFHADFISVAFGRLPRGGFIQ